MKMQFVYLYVVLLDWSRIHRMYGSEPKMTDHQAFTWNVIKC